jgi:hypothetical protein
MIYFQGNNHAMRNALFILLAGALFCCYGSLQAQDSPAQSSKQRKEAVKEAYVGHLVDTAYFRFKAEWVLPLGGRSRYLTSDYYDLTVSRDTIVAYLPYFGRAYSAPMDPSQNGIQFTSKDFIYTTTPRKKGGWNISIKFNDAGDVKQMELTVTTDGNASLQVTSVNRQSISFNGHITGRKKTP